MPEPIAQQPNIMDDQTPGFAEITDATALARVLQTFSKYESWRFANYDRRWTVNAQLYNGVVPQRKWEGTEVPRSSLSDRLIFTQVQSVLPLLHQALFGYDVEWFQVGAMGQTTPQAADQIQARLLYLCEHPADRFGNNVRNQITLGFYDLLVKNVIILSMQVDPLTLEPVVNRVSPLDLYIDPGCGPDIEEAKSVIWRRSLTIDQVDALREAPGFRVPSRETLMGLKDETQLTMADSAAQQQERARGVWYTPGVDNQGVFGADQDLELLIYYTKTKVTWVLNRRYVIYNGDNPYGFYPFVAATCFFDPDRFYGQGYADVLADLQKYKQSIKNARLDELSLALNPPRAIKASHDARLTFSQRMYRPGALQQFSDPKNDLIIQQPQNITGASYQEEGMINQEAQNYTGVNSMTIQGTPIRSNASSSATSINAQREMPSVRLLMIILSLENFLLVPMLHKMLKMHQLHTQGNLTLRGMDAEGGDVQVANEEVQNAEVKFRILAGSRMMSKEKLAQIFPFVTQYLINPELMALFQKSGMVVDIAEWLRMLQDAAGTKYRYQLVRPLNEQERQAMMQPTPEMVQDQQKTQASNEVRLAMADKKVEGEKLKVEGKLEETQQKNAAAMQQEILKMLASRLGSGGETGA